MATGQPFVLRQQQSVGGGCINSAATLESDAERYFVKLNQASQVDMFEAEFAGLQEIARSRTIRVPAPVCVGISDGYAYLVLEYITQGQTNPRSIAQL
ncbi:MAG: fructosamine kinase family protein, partial [Acidiferrobacterales bacterium]